LAASSPSNALDPLGSTSNPSCPRRSAAVPRITLIHGAPAPRSRLTVASPSEEPSVSTHHSPDGFTPSVLLDRLSCQLSRYNQFDGDTTCSRPNAAAPVRFARTPVSFASTRPASSASVISPDSTSPPGLRSP